ncbi:hypothetical protein JTL98_34890, partial [Pseudomonas aeruginosa]|nr:hypothetical protein [Pseudomonas aeruginosa]
AVRGDAPNTTQRIALSRHRLALAKELYKTRDPALRQTIHQQLDEVSRAMGLPTPENTLVLAHTEGKLEALRRRMGGAHAKETSFTFMRFAQSLLPVYRPQS